MLDSILAKFAFNAFEAIFKKASKGISERINHALAAKAYARKMYQRYNFIRIFGMSDEVPLRSLYVRLNILEELTPTLRGDIEEMTKAFDFSKRSLSFGSKRATLPATKVLNESQHFIVLGKPGAGKTTLLKYYVLQSLDCNTDTKRIPIFISLKAFSDENITLFQYIVEQFHDCHISNAAFFVENLLKNGDVLILMDGLDEVQETDKDRVIQQMNKLTKRYDTNQFVISCRIAAYHDQFHRFKNVEVADFEDNQIELFIKNWFAKDYRIAKDCWNKLQETPQVKELAAIPLLLTLICITFRRITDFPPSRAEIYQTAIDALLRDWDGSRGIRRSEIYKGISPKVKENLLAAVAYHSFIEGEYFMHQRRVQQLIEDFIENLPTIETQKLHIESRKILKDIDSHNGILTKRAHRIYSFSHLTFQEYFNAKYIVDNATEGTLDNLVKHHVLDNRWKEVVLLVMNLLPKADHLFKLIHKKLIESLQKTPIFQNVLQQLPNILKIIDSNTQYLQKSLGLFSILKYAYEFSYANDYKLPPEFNLTLDLTRNLINELSTNIKQTRNLARNLEGYQSQTLEPVSHFSLEISNHTEEIPHIINYLNYYEIIILSLNSNVYIYKSTRKKLMEDFLSIPSELTPTSND